MDGTLRFPDLAFTNELTDTSSAAYMALRDQVTNAVSDIHLTIKTIIANYKQNIEDTINLRGFQFTQGLSQRFTKRIDLIFVNNIRGAP